MFHAPPFAPPKGGYYSPLDSSLAKLISLGPIIIPYSKKGLPADGK
jgi:hypothetical protein